MVTMEVNEGSLFRHVTAERAAFYRAIMLVFGAAKRQFRLHLRPDEVRLEAEWPAHALPSLDVVQQALSQLVDWGNLTAQPDTTRVASLEDFYRARFLYRLSAGGEAVEAGMAAFAQSMVRRAELQSVALEDILARLESLRVLAQAADLDAGKVHETLRDLTSVFTSLAENAQAFMSNVSRSIELQQADATALMAYKKRLIDYLERFIGDLIARSALIAECLADLAPSVEKLLSAIAEREARDAAPEGESAIAAAVADKRLSWRERWTGLERWFTSDGPRPSQAELLRGRARSAIPQLLAAISLLNERRGGKSDRSADFRVLARWFAECSSDHDAHRLFRAAFALHPARHLALRTLDDDVSANRSWSDAPTVAVHPKLRERGSLSPRGASPKIRDRSDDRALIAASLADEQRSLTAAREKLATGKPVLLSELGYLDRHEFRLLLSLVGEALSAQLSADGPVQRMSADGLLQIKLVPLGRDTVAALCTEHGVFAGRDHELTISFASQG